MTDNNVNELSWQFTVFGIELSALNIQWKTSEQPVPVPARAWVRLPKERRLTIVDRLVKGTSNVWVKRMNK
ncbi:hypothetical protein J4U02_gp139 [Mycobacterium phage Aziz]|uniref:Uncharacterized protein n=1 Tax=Mycobacterium phage Aziz TaxID=2762281 RepID=A0A7G8LHQ1_9CAUD|nr:hypothetical protein J4U02_gp139 [Mycobacterium phage Aziz]QNJ56773.1 hypothetical protein SEA_AZIZ_135 [Mycobacterium phage Aziz]